MAKTLIASISGIRGIFGNGLGPSELVRYAAAFGAWLRQQVEGRRPRVVVGRDGRVTGSVCARFVTATLQSVGCDVVDADLATTPTVEVAVLAAEADGGVVLSASHNPAEWNALKLLNRRGEFLTPDEARQVLALADAGAMPLVSWEQLGCYEQRDFLEEHVQRILALDFIEPERIRRRHFRVVVDGINSVGAIALPLLLRRLGVAEVLLLNGEPNGRFAHPPEPLPEHLHETIQTVARTEADLGLVVDPDADRLALIANGGVYVSEELTQVIAADFLWRFREGPFVTNLSSSRAIEEVAARYGMPVYRAAVGEINVVQKMKEVGAILGGEGNGGVILPDVHYGRDALVGTAMVLQHLANLEQSLAEFVATLPRYAMVKHKLPLAHLDVEQALQRLARRYAHARISTLDGLKIDLEEGWVHLRKSNTEPILRIYAEARTPEEAAALVQRFVEEMQTEQ
ncbi:phosphoglucosamine mutase [Rhodothermus profundi]|uniref:Phosphomannomutase n=1 Tax=Rhodothermus profundi TaxID=633813 RepID=A0A1M6Q412_9BACT|nr:phosphoglucosamine mutase [Rhodothermus profundi]SHK14847.1 phosphomannomutase [Rhodothermus profundi]